MPLPTHSSTSTAFPRKVLEESKDWLHHQPSGGRIVSLPPWPNNNVTLDVGRELHHPDASDGTRRGTYHRPYQIEDMAISGHSRSGGCGDSSSSAVPYQSPSMDRQHPLPQPQQHRYLACVCNDSLIRVWDCSTGYCLILPGNERTVQVEFDPTNPNCIITSGSHPSFYVFDDIGSFFSRRNNHSSYPNQNHNHNQSTVYSISNKTIIPKNYKRNVWTIRPPGNDEIYEPCAPSRFAITSDGQRLATAVSVVRSRSSTSTHNNTSSYRCCYIVVCSMVDGSVLHRWRHSKPTRIYFHFYDSLFFSAGSSDDAQPTCCCYLMTMDWSDRNVTVWDVSDKVDHELKRKRQRPRDSVTKTPLPTTIDNHRGTASMPSAATRAESSVPSSVLPFTYVENLNSAVDWLLSGFNYS